MPCSYYDGATVVCRYRDQRQQAIYDAAYQAELDTLRKSFTQEEQQAEQTLDELREALDEATHDGCVLREALLAVTQQQELRSPFLTRVRKAQVEHRKMDLERLKDVLQGKIERARKLEKLREYQEKLWLVEHASANIPLQEQLGFDPDSM
jgi:uncharacterized protein YfcZ (UPF0381/DUF406 family)